MIYKVSKNELEEYNKKEMKEEKEMVLIVIYVVLTKRLEPPDVLKSLVKLYAIIIVQNALQIIKWQKLYQLIMVTQKHKKCKEEEEKPGEKDVESEENLVRTVGRQNVEEKEKERNLKKFVENNLERKIL